MTNTVARKKIEILVDEILAPRIVALAGSSGIKAHTLLPAVSGMGQAGSWHDDQVSGAEAKVMFFAVTSEEKAQVFVDALAPFLESYGLILLISDVAVVRAAKF